MGLVVFQQLERRRLGTLVSSRTVLSSGLSFFFFFYAEGQLSFEALVIYAFLPISQD